MNQPPKINFLHYGNGTTRCNRMSDFCPKGLLCSGPQIGKMFVRLSDVVCHAQIAQIGKVEAGFGVLRVVYMQKSSKTCIF